MLVPTVGIEPTSSPYEGDALPLSYVGSGALGGNRTQLSRLQGGCIATMLPSAEVSGFVFDADRPGAWRDHAKFPAVLQGAF